MTDTNSIPAISQIIEEYLIQQEKEAPLKAALQAINAEKTKLRKCLYEDHYTNDSQHYLHLSEHLGGKPVYFYVQGMDGCDDYDLPQVYTRQLIPAADLPPMPESPASDDLAFLEED